MITKSDLVAEGLPKLARGRPLVTRPPASSAPSPGLDERVVILVIALAVVACASLAAASQGLLAAVSEQPARIATLLALTLALQMFSVQVYGRGSVSVSAIGILASAFLFDTGTTMAIAVLAATGDAGERVLLSIARGAVAYLEWRGRISLAVGVAPAGNEPDGRAAAENLAGRDA